MTARQFVESNFVRFTVYALIVGIAWATLKAEVAQKAEKADVAEMAADLNDVKSMLCKMPENITDSACLQDRKGRRK